MAVLLSPSRLNTHLGCAHASTLWLAGVVPPEPSDAMLDLIRAKGFEHESQVLSHLEAELGPAVRIPGEGRYDERCGATLAAMREGVPLIFQGALLAGDWIGLPDFLLRRPAFSGEGWSYAAEDAKLARRAGPSHVLQLAVYHRLLTQVAGAAHPHGAIHGAGGEPERFDLRTTEAVATRLMRQFERAVRGGPAGTRPVRVATCAQCEYRARCEAEWRAADSPIFVAGARGDQVARLETSGLSTLEALSRHPTGEPLAGFAQETLDRLSAQARLQARGREDGRPIVEVLPAELGRGFALLPPPAEGDLFFDIEGDPLYPEGLEYLFGLWGPLQTGRPDRFRAIWAHDRAEEKQGFQALMEMFRVHLDRHPQARIYHYSQYEPAALKRLSMRHAVLEPELDQMLRDQRFVDLFRIVRQALRASVEGYGLKALEPLYRAVRTGEVTSAADSIVDYELWRTTGDSGRLAAIEAYNREDCASLAEMRDWLERLRPEDGAFGRPLLDERPVAPERIAERDAFQERRRRLADRVRAAPHGDGRVRDLIAELLWFHQRAEKPQWWALFDKQTWTDDELIEDAESLGGLILDPTRPPRPEKKSVLVSYRFPPQDTKLKEGKTPRIAQTLAAAGEIFELDETAGSVTLKRGPSLGRAPDACSLLACDAVSSKNLVAAIVAFAERFASGDVIGDQALLDFLARGQPRIAGRAGGTPIVAEAQDVVEGAIAAVRALDHSYLFLQGPPGAGKTYTAAQAVLALVADGRRVAITSNSHKAIHKLLAEIEAQARQAEVRFRGAKKGNRSDEDTAYRSEMFETVYDADSITDDHRVIGATAYHFCCDTERSRYSHLVVDEAGQVSLGNLVATAGCADNLVLVGDQMQLSQPIQGVHPGETGLSILDYLLEHRATVPPERGVLLNETRRMHSSLTRLISSAVYEGRLRSHPANDERRLVLGAGAGPAVKPFGISFVAVDHQGCTQSSAPEAAAVARLLDDLLRQQLLIEGVQRPLTIDDVLVVAPFNMQVNLLGRSLPEGAQVGTIDKFQGQQAPVVIISMTTSTGGAAPRGTEFLFSRNRFNVALSRAQCLAIVVHGERLFDVPFRSVEDLQRLDLFARAEAEAAGD